MSLLHHNRAIDQVCGAAGFGRPWEALTAAVILLALVAVPAFALPGPNCGMVCDSQCLEHSCSIENCDEAQCESSGYPCDNCQWPTGTYCLCTFNTWIYHYKCSLCSTFWDDPRCSGAGWCDLVTSGETAVCEASTAALTEPGGACLRRGGAHRTSLAAR